MVVMGRMMGEGLLILAVLGLGQPEERVDYTGSQVPILPSALNNNI